MLSIQMVSLERLTHLYEKLNVVIAVVCDLIFIYIYLQHHVGSGEMKKE